MMALDFQSPGIARLGPASRDQGRRNSKDRVMFGFFKHRKLRRQIREAVLAAEPMHLLGVLAYRHANDPDLSPHQRDEANAQGEILLAQAEEFRQYLAAPDGHSKEEILPYLAAVTAMKMAGDKIPHDDKLCRANLADMMASLDRPGAFAQAHGAACAEVGEKIAIFVKTRRPESR